MKNLLTCLFSVLVIGAFAQVPEGFNYQAVVRDNTGLILPDQIVSFQVAIAEQSANGTVKYVENHLENTNQHGLVNFKIGQGTPVSGSFELIEWWNNDYFLRLSIDLSGGNNFEFIGASQLMSVPYAHVAGRVADDGDTSSENELQWLTISEDTLFITEGNYVVLPSATGGTDDQVLALTNNILIIEGGNSIDLSSYLDNTDAQELTLSGNELSITGGNSVSLSENTDEQQLSVDGNDLTISGGNTVTLPIPPPDDNQGLILSGDILSIEDGNSVDLSSYANTDNQELSLQGANLSISGGNAITLPIPPDNQELTLSGNTLSIQDGNSVDLTSFANTDNQTLQLFEDQLTIIGGNTVTISDDVDDADADPENEIQNLSLSGTSLELSNATAVDLSSFMDNTDQQTLSVLGNSLIISGGNSVDLNSLSGAALIEETGVVMAAENYSTADFVFGSPQLNNDGDFSHNARFFFDKDKLGAFRAGYVQDDKWDSDSLGVASFAAGQNSKASGDYSAAIGRDVFAEGVGSIAIGRNTIASGFAATASGFGSRALGSYSFAGGNKGKATGTNGFAFGQDALANGNNTIAIGKNAIAGAVSALAFGNTASANANQSIAIGKNTVALLLGSIAIGESAIANGSRGIALGYNVAAPSYGETVVGYNNTEYTPLSDQLIFSNDRLFTVGNGINASSRSDAFIIYKDGDAWLAGSVSTNSDQRLKQNVKPLTRSLDKIKLVNGYSYNWNDLTPRDTKQLNIGVIAQEIEEIFPELVMEDQSGYKSVNYISLIPYLIESIKEQSKLIDEMDRTISQQSNEIDQLKTKTVQLEELNDRIKALERNLILGER